jgi:general nucleoside transport system permease protein
VIAQAEPIDSRFALTYKHVGIAGCVLAFLAFWIALPPVHGRSPAWSILFGVAGIAAGIWAAREERRLGVSVVIVSLLGLLLGILATRSSVAHLDDVFTWSTLIAQGLVFATPLIFASMGGLFSERSGVVNIGLEGMMLMGCFWGIYGADKTGNWVLGVLIGMASGGLLALVHAFFAIHLRADQIVGGTAINFLSVGITGYFFVQLYAGNNIPAGVPAVPNLHILPSSLYFFGPAFGDLDIMIWIAFLVVLLTYVVVFKTPLGLRIRACGEHPRAADTVGINVYAVRYGCVILSGMLAGAGGAYLSLGAVGSFNDNMTDGRGFIALAALIFGNWRPFGAFGAALLFGISGAVALRMQTYSGTLPGIDVLFLTLPYFITLIAVAGVIGRSTPPAAVGRPYKKQ